MPLGVSPVVEVRTSSEDRCGIRSGVVATPCLPHRRGERSSSHEIQ
jgi:hypothetical protein